VISRLGRPVEPDPTGASKTDLIRELRALPPKPAAALVVRHLHGFSNREIAAALEIRERTVASRLPSAKSRMRAPLSDRTQVQVGTTAPSTVSM
jgi:DNA-directed RNA polymerase specialized sigma24 family protein